MLNGGDGGRLKGNVAADLEEGGTNEGFANRLRTRRSLGTAEQQEQSGCPAYLRYGTYGHACL
jgi:hypothetical protein